jgi:hypothetical protein
LLIICFFFTFKATKTAKTRETNKLFGSTTNIGKKVENCNRNKSTRKSINENDDHNLNSDNLVKGDLTDDDNEPMNISNKKANDLDSHRGMIKMI